MDLALDDRQADGLTGIRCGGSDGALVAVGWADRPPDVLARLRVSPEATRGQIFAHDECRLTRATPTSQQTDW